MPLRLTVGAKGLKDGVVELRDRRSKEVLKMKPEGAVQASRRRGSEDDGVKRTFDVAIIPIQFQHPITYHSVSDVLFFPNAHAMPMLST